MSIGLPTAFGPAAPPQQALQPDQSRPSQQQRDAAEAAKAAKGVEPLLKKQPDPLLADGPPDGVLAEVDRAHKVVEQLAAQNVEMRFDVDQGSGQITVELRDGNGKTLRTITLVEALDVASGRLAPFDAGTEPDADHTTGASGEPRADVYDSKGRLT